MRADYHVHTQFSDDSCYDMEQVVLDAMAMGIDEICFTDHVDYGVKKDWDEPGEMSYRRGGPGEPEKMPLANVDYPLYFDKYRKLKKKYQDRIVLKIGMEFGMQAHTIDRYEKLFAAYPFDFILLSVHEIEDKEFWNQEFQKNRTQQEYIERYYEELRYLVQHYHNYSVLGHLDLITRYDQAGGYPFERIKPLLEEILQTVIRDGKGIEVNTSSHRYGLQDLTPSREILRLYRELGGRIVTIGSDAHKPEHLGACLEETKRELKALGFTQLCTYERMEPVYHPLQEDFRSVSRVL